MKSLETYTVGELEEILVDLLTQRTDGTISPGEYRSKAIDILDVYRRKLNEAYGISGNTKDNYDRAMKGII